MRANPRIPEGERLSCALRVYVSPKELQALDQIATVMGRSNIIRRAIALFISTKYPELKDSLRKDLTLG